MYIPNPRRRFTVKGSKRPLLDDLIGLTWLPVKLPAGRDVSPQVVFADSSRGMFQLVPTSSLNSPFLYGADCCGLAATII